MAEGIKIEIFKLKNADELTKSLADPESRMETGGAAAMTAALSASLLERAAAVPVSHAPVLRVAAAALIGILMSFLPLTSAGEELIPLIL